MTSGTLDVLVVGAGATGAGVALDAVTRGLRVGLVDRGDVAQGTSSKSSKLVHGGLRYLQTGDVAMVAEGVRERDRLRRLAPHLVRPLGFVVPCDTVADAALVGAGMLAYDLLAAGRAVASSARLRADDVLAEAPALARGFDAGGWRYHDAQTDDARLVLAVAATARRHGALVATHARLDDLALGAGGAEATLHDQRGDDDVVVRARHVVLAGGVWADRVPGSDGLGFALTPAKGTHLTFSQEDLPVRRATVIPSASGDGRRLFLVPWGRQTYVGTNDVPDPGGITGPSVTHADATELLDSVNLACGTSLGLDDTTGAWAGLRPLVAADGDTADLSRRHAVASPRPGVWAVTGGKLTTYRQMAEDVVDAILDADGRTAPCRTTRVQLGATGSVSDARRRVQAAGARVGLRPGACDAVWHRHGDRAVEVVGFCAAVEGGLEPAVDGLPYLRGELDWAVAVEDAQTVEDVLARRLRATERDVAAGGGAIALTADLLAARHGWDDARRSAEVRTFRDAVRRERGVVPLAD